MIRFNDVNKSIINLNYVEQIDLNPNLTFFNEEKYYYIRIDYISGNHYFLKYKKVDEYYHDKKYLEDNLVIDI